MREMGHEDDEAAPHFLTTVLRTLFPRAKEGPVHQSTSHRSRVGKVGTEGDTTFLPRFPTFMPTIKDGSTVCGKGFQIKIRDI